MVSAADNLTNLADAAWLVADSLGLAGINPRDFTQTERLAYTKSLAQTVVSHPDLFTPASLTSAQIILSHNQNGMELANYFSDSADGSMTLQNIFAQTLYDTELHAGAQLANVGNGALNLLSSAGNVLTNTGNAADNLTGSASNSWVMIAVLAIALGIAASSVSREARQWRD